MTGRPDVPNRVWLTRVGCAHNPLLGPEIVPLVAEQTLILGRDHHLLPMIHGCLADTLKYSRGRALES